MLPKFFRRLYCLKINFIYILLNCIKKVINLLYFRCDLLTNKKKKTPHYENATYSFLARNGNRDASLRSVSETDISRDKSIKNYSVEIRELYQHGRNQPRAKSGQRTPEIGNRRVQGPHSRRS
jgi:hypothetical protein